MSKRFLKFLLSAKRNPIVILVVILLLIVIAFIISIFITGMGVDLSKLRPFGVVVFSLILIVIAFFVRFALKCYTLNYRLFAFFYASKGLPFSDIDLGRIFDQDYMDYLSQCFGDHKDIKQKAEYEFLQQQAKFDAMQSQINPHFLYNALDSIRGLALEQGADETANMAEALSSMFRYCISQSDDLQTLEQELDNVRNYMKIQQYRFNNRFKLNIDIDMQIEQICDCVLPKLTLQPIVENAIYHGFDEIPENNIITIKLIPTQSRLIICISDNGLGMDDETLLKMNKRLLSGSYEIQNDSPNKKSRGIALVNVNSRIKLIFGNNYGLTAYSTKGIGTEIRITLPLIYKN